MAFAAFEEVALEVGAVVEIASVTVEELLAAESAVLEFAVVVLWLLPPVGSAGTIPFELTPESSRNG